MGGGAPQRSEGEAVRVRMVRGPCCTDQGDGRPGEVAEEDTGHRGWNIVEGVSVACLPDGPDCLARENEPDDGRVLGRGPKGGQEGGERGRPCRPGGMGQTRPRLPHHTDEGHPCPSRDGAREEEMVVGLFDPAEGAERGEGFGWKDAAEAVAQGEAAMDDLPTPKTSFVYGLGHSAKLNSLPQV
jgi:hypothetical protein